MPSASSTLLFFLLFLSFLMIIMMNMIGSSESFQRSIRKMQNDLQPLEYFMKIDRKRCVYTSSFYFRINRSQKNKMEELISFHLEVIQYSSKSNHGMRKHAYKHQHYHIQYPISNNRFRSLRIFKKNLYP